MIRELLERLKLDKPALAPLRIWKAYERIETVSGGNPINELVALVSLIRRITGIDEALTPYDKIVDKNFQAWVFKKQAEALRMSTLKKAFAGKLVPQDPNDEPAEKLLACIRAERAAQIPGKGRGKGKKALSSPSASVGDS